MEAHAAVGAALPESRTLPGAEDFNYFKMPPAIGLRR